MKSDHAVLTDEFLSCRVSCTAGPPLARVQHLDGTIRMAYATYTVAMQIQIIQHIHSLVSPAQVGNQKVGVLSVRHFSHHNNLYYLIVVVVTSSLPSSTVVDPSVVTPTSLPEGECNY